MARKPTYEELEQRVKELESDVAERKRPEEEVRLLSTAIEQCSEGMATSDLDGNLLYLNKAFAEMHGYLPGELVGRHLSIFHTAEQIPSVESANRQLKETGEFSGEIWHVRRDGTVFPTLMHNSLLRDEAHNPIGMIGTLRDISDMKRDQDALRESEKKFRALTEQSPNMIFIVNMNGRIVYANERYKEIMGYTPDELCSPDFDFLSMVAPESLELAESSFKKHREGKEVDTDEYTLIKKGGGLINTVVNTKLIDFDGDKAVLGVVTDVTEHRRAEEALRKVKEELEQRVLERTAGLKAANEKLEQEMADRKRVGESLRESEERLRLFMESATDCFSLYDSQLNFLDINEASMKFFPPNTRKEDVIGKNMSEWAPVLKPSGRYDKYLEVIRSGEPFFSDDIVTDPRLGKRHVDVRAFKVGNGLGIVAADITERKVAEQELRKSEERYRSLFEMSPDVISHVSPEDGTVTSLNPAFEKLTGWSTTEMIGKPFTSVLHPDDVPIAMDVFQRFLSGEDLPPLELRVLSKSGEEMFGEFITKQEIERGEVVSLVSYIRNITDHKRAKDALKKSEEKYRKLFEEITDAIFVADPETGILTDCNRAALALVGREGSELVGKHQRILHPPEEIEGEFSRTFKQHVKGKEGKVLGAQVITKKGEIKDVAIRANLLELGGKKLIQGMFRDITDHKRAEQALKKSEEKYRSILENMEEGYYEVDTAGNFTFFNDSMWKVLGYSKDELVGMNNRQIMDQKNAKKVFEKFNRVYTTGKPDKGTDWEVIRKDGTKRTIETSISLMKDGEGRAIGFRGVARDITERKRAREALRRSQELYRILVETMNDGLGVEDENGFSTYVNEKLCKMLGFSRDELIGHPFTDFLDKANQKILREKTVRRRRVKRKPYELKWTAKDGRKISTLISPAPIFDGKGHFKGSFAVITDISKLKQSQQKLREREKELKINTRNLEEVNAALRVLLKKRDEDRAEIEEKVLFNVEELIIPFLDKMKKSRSVERQKAYIDILKSNLNDIISSFSRSLTSRYLSLTPAEIRVANLIKQGKATKDIADLLNLSRRTIEDHRKNIRKKLGIRNMKANLKTHLQSIH